MSTQYSPSSSIVEGLKPSSWRYPYDISSMVSSGNLISLSSVSYVSSFSRTQTSSALSSASNSTCSVYQSICLCWLLTDMLVCTWIEDMCRCRWCNASVMKLLVCLATKEGFTFLVLCLCPLSLRSIWPNTSPTNIHYSPSLQTDC